MGDEVGGLECLTTLSDQLVMIGNFLLDTFLLCLCKIVVARASTRPSATHMHMHMDLYDLKCRLGSLTTALHVLSTDLRVQILWRISIEYLIRKQK